MTVFLGSIYCKITKSCYCHACRRYFHPLGMPRHRKMHIDRGDKVKITYSDGKTIFS